MAEPEVNYAVLADLLDDMTPKQLTGMICWMWTNMYHVTRGNIKGWRKMTGLPVNDNPHDV